MSGLGSFIQGAFKGYEYGEAIKDRKTQRKRDEKRWEWEKENRDWQRENRDWQRENNEWARTQRSRQREAWERQDDERDAMVEIYDDARESYDAGNAPPPGQVATPSSQGQTPAQARPARGVIDPPDTQTAAQGPQDAADVAPTRPQQRPRTVLPQPSASSEAPQQPAPPGNPGQPMQPQPGPAAPQAGEPAPQPAARPAQTMQPGRSVRGADGQTATGQGAPMPQSFAQNQRAQQAAEKAGITLDHLWSRMRPEGQQLFMEQNGQPTPTPPQTRPQTSAQGRPQMGAQQPPEGAANAARAQNANMVPRRGPGPVAGAEQPAPGEPARSAPQKPGAPGEAPIVGNIDVRTASTEQLDAQAAQNGPDQGGAPSVQAAGAAIQETSRSSRGVIGNQTGEVAPEDEERASQTFMQHYAETAVPKVVDYYLSQGNVEKATAFQEWADSQKVKGQMASWSKAIWAITNGDEDRFVDHLSATYNAIDDGLTVDPKQTKFKHDKDGNIVGATLAIRNDETGEVSFTEYDDQQDIVEMAVYALAPEQTFEYLWGLSERARELRIEAETGQNNDVGRLDMAQEIRREADSIRGSQEFAPAETRLSEAQIEEQARQNVYRRLGVSSGASAGQDAGVLPQEPPRLR